MEVKATLEEKVSKAGNPYSVLVIHLTDTYQKFVYLDKAEIELLNAKRINNDDKPDTEFWK